jgi:hypothetical protein
VTPTWSTPKDVFPKAGEAHGGLSMIRKSLVVAAIVATFATPAFAATTYYVAQDATTHKCSVTSKKPDGKTMMMIGKAGYTTKAKATTAMGAAAECKAM